MTDRNRIITLITDFGTQDSYVGAMKGMILNVNPSATIIDISHEIEPQNIHQAAYILKTTCHYYPDDTIHLIVVDPGVGTDRKAVILQTPEAFFIAPDNGILSYVMDNVVEAVSITNPQYWASSISPTFHGRDIFAPVAAHLSLGTPLREFGETFSTLVQLPESNPVSEADGSIIGHVIHIDRFGNLITDIHRSHISTDITIKIKGHCIDRLSSTYAESNDLLALIGSDEHLEIGLKNGNAAAFLGLKYGEEIKINASRKASD
jgi:S-adenosylmethionine hydrolase